MSVLVHVSSLNFRNRARFADPCDPLWKLARRSGAVLDKTASRVCSQGCRHSGPAPATTEIKRERMGTLRLRFVPPILLRAFVAGALALGGKCCPLRRHSPVQTVGAASSWRSSPAGSLCCAYTSLALRLFVFAGLALYGLSANAADTDSD